MVLVLGVTGLGHPRLGAWFKFSRHFAMSFQFEHAIDGQVRSSCMPICLACLDLEIAGRGAFVSRAYRTKDVRADIRPELGFGVRDGSWLKSSIHIGSRILVTIQWVLGRWEVIVNFLMIFVESFAGMRHSLSTLRIICRRHWKTTFILRPVSTNHFGHRPRWHWHFAIWGQKLDHLGFV